MKGSDNFYSKELKSIAPLSFDLLGYSFFEKHIPTFLKELEISSEPNLENLYYLPLFLKKNQKQLELNPHMVELIDFEFQKFMIEQNVSTLKNSEISEVFLNPVGQALRHEFDVLDMIESFNFKDPKPNKTLLLLSQDPKTQCLTSFKGSFLHAAIIDELHDGKILKEKLDQILYSKFPKVSPKEWEKAFSELKNIFFIC